MTEDLISFIDNLKKNLRFSSYSEDQTKMAIVQPILRRLGWDIENVDEVCPEFSVENRRVDYALRLDGRCTVFIEAKKPSEDLESQNHQEQLLDYSFRQGVEIAVLTNGITWLLYLPRAGGDWKSRKFYTIDIIEQETSNVASKFVDLLSKKNIESDKALHNAEDIHKGKLKEKAIHDALPESWNRIIEEPDSLIVELIAERTERICSYKPELTEVSKFLKHYQAQFLLLPAEEQLELQKGQRVRTKEEPSVQEPSDDRKISQDALIPHLIAILKRHGGRASKEQVEKDIYAMFKGSFEHPWYQEKVAGDIPRWQHNLAWARERAKK
ncbi:MAG: type I restriction endonuclease [Nitrospinota bacterium]